MKPAFVYILERLAKTEYYIGCACDPQFRLLQHNGGNVKATKYKRPYKLVFQQEFESLNIAKQIERKIKNWKRKDWIEKIIRDGKIKFIKDD